MSEPDLTSLLAVAREAGIAVDVDSNGRGTFLFSDVAVLRRLLNAPQTAAIATERARADALQAERDESDALRKRLAELLKQTAVALRGEPPPLTSWSWHDVPERAAAAIAAIDVMQRAAATNAERADALEAALRAEIARLTDRAVEIERESLAHERRADALEAALRELVECKDLKEQMQSCRSDPYYITQADAMECEYERRKPAAWATARALLEKKT